MNSEQTPTRSIPIGRVIRSVGIGYIGGLLTLLLGFVAKFIAIRQSSVVEFGVYSSVLSILGIALSVAQLGLQDGIVRMVASQRGNNHHSSDQILRKGLMVGVSVALAIAALLWLGTDQICANILHRPELADWLRPLWLVLPFWVAANLIAAYMQGMGSIGLRAILVDGSRLGSFCILVIVLARLLIVHSGQTLIVALAGSIVVSFTVTVIYAAVRFKKTLSREYQFNTPILPDLLRYSLPLLAANLITLIVTSGNVLMLGIMSGAKDAALYSAILALGQVIGLGGTALDLVLLPMFTELATTNRRAELESLYWMMARWSLFLITPLTIITANFPDVILRVLFGGNYVEGANALRVVSIFFFLHTAAGPNEAALKTLQSTSRLFAVRVITIVWMVSIGWTASIRFGYMGMFAGWGTGLMLYNLLLWWLLKQANILSKAPRAAIIMFVVCILALILPFIFNELSVFPRFVGTLCLYIALMGLTYKRFAELFTEDRDMVHQVLIRIKQRMSRTQKDTL